MKRLAHTCVSLFVIGFLSVFVVGVGKYTDRKVLFMFNILHRENY